MLGKRAVLEAEPMLRERGLRGRRPLLRRPVRRRAAGARHGALRHAPRRAGGELHRGALAGADRGPGGRGRRSRTGSPARRATIRAERGGQRHRALGRPDPDAWRTPAPRRCSSPPRASTSWWTGAGSTTATASSSPARSTAGCSSSCPGATSPTSARPTPTPPSRPTSSSVTAEDMVYLLRSANARFPNARLGLEDVRGAWAGLRPLLADRTREAGDRAARGSTPSCRARAA